MQIPNRKAKQILEALEELEHLVPADNAVLLFKVQSGQRILKLHLNK